MRNFIISTVCLVLVICIWYGFHFYSQQQTDRFQAQLDTIITEYIGNNRWSDAKPAIDNLNVSWKRFRHTAAFFLDTTSLDDIDCTIQRCRYYIYAEDGSNSSGELSYLKNLFSMLHENEKLIPENIL